VKESQDEERDEERGSVHHCSILVGLGWWLEFGWVAGVTVGGTMAAGVLGVGIWSIYQARHRRRS
jgi:hypothetical protein